MWIGCRPHRTAECTLHNRSRRGNHQPRIFAKEIEQLTQRIDLIGEAALRERCDLSKEDATKVGIIDRPDLA